MAKYLKLIICMLAVVALCACEKTPEVGGTGTVTPVVDPTNTDEPADDMITISAERIGELSYRFTADRRSVTTSSTVKWSIKDPDKTQSTFTTDQRTIEHTFNKAGQARIKVIFYNDDNNGGLIQVGHKIIYIIVE